MNIQIFPRWCKKLGIVLFILFAFLDGKDDFLRGYNEGVHTANNYTEIVNSDIVLFEVLTFVGMLIYMLSKERVEDDFIQKLRLESYQISLLIITMLALVFSLIGWSQYVEMGSVIFLLLSVYLITFAIKKRTV